MSTTKDKDLEEKKDTKVDDKENKPAEAKKPEEKKEDKDKKDGGCCGS